MASTLIAGLVFSLAPAEPTYELGEALWLVVHVENDTSELVRGGVWTMADHHWDLNVEVVAPDGRPYIDAWRAVEHSGIGPASTRVDVAPGDSVDLWIDLAKYAWIDKPGTFQVRLLAPFGARITPTPPDDPRWVETEVVVVAPTDLHAVVRTHPTSIDHDALWSQKPIPPRELDTFDALGHAVYVPVLESYDDERAVRGIASCPCPEATEALLRLYDRASDPTLLKAIQSELSRRTPWLLPSHQGRHDPEFEPSFVARAWVDRLTVPVLARARANLTGSTHVPGWCEAYRWGAAMVGRFGGPSDASLVRAAYGRAIDGDARDCSRGQVGRTLAELTDAFVRQPGEVQVQLEPTEVAETRAALRQIHGGRDEPTPEWSNALVAALASSEPTLVVEAVFALRSPPSSAILEAVLPLVGSQDRLVAGELHRYLGELALPASAMRAPLFDELATAEPWRVAWLLRELQPYVARDEWLNLTLTKLSADPTNRDLVDVLLLGLSGCVERSRGPVLPEEAPRMVTAWMNALRTHDLRTSPLPVVSGETDPALAPSSFDCKLASGETWPAR